ncbi:MAG: MaoC family dehydratase N-terminal domain-containing protein [Burkholderiales bacterium]|nr:MaoC family dehydratase N-terminal domain-containing protein [Burkholderiales bacterium]
MDAQIRSATIKPVPGTALPVLRKGPYTSARLVKWCAAQQNWDRIHYDLDYARQHAGLKERVINGALKQHLLVQVLHEAFGDSAWLRRLAFKFVGPDFVGESLEVHATVRSVEPLGAGSLIIVDLAIRNTVQQRDTTTGWAALVVGSGPFTDAEAPMPELPAAYRFDESVTPASGPVPAAVAALLGVVGERIESAYPLDLSRLRLFADAVGGLRTLHYDLEQGRNSPYGTVVATPLFPLHALEARPDSLPLSDDPAAMGREGVNEIGRNLGRRCSLPESGMVNGGSDIELASLLRLGETVHATSMLLSANVKSSAQSGQMLIVTALNTYRTSAGRLLLKEKQTGIYRNFI